MKKTMSLINFPEIRVRKLNKGYVVECKHRTWFGITYWKHIVGVSGLEHLAWQYTNKDMLIDDVTNLFYKHLIRSIC